MSIENIFNSDKFSKEFQINSNKEYLHYLLNGEIRKWNGKNINVFSPIYSKDSEGNLTSVFLGNIPKMDKNTALEALESASKSYNNGKGVWPQMTSNDRIFYIVKFLHLLIKKRDNIVKFLMWEIGKSLIESQNEFDRTTKYIEDTILAYKNIVNQSLKVQLYDNVYGKTGRDSLGVVLCLAPYNFPLNETFCMLIPALIMGNTVIYKPAEQGVLFVSELLNAFKECFPKGVINVLFGKGEEIATPIIKSGKVNVLALIGNSKSANALLQQVPNRNRLRLILGLEAKNAAIILPDADVDLAVSECLLGSLGFNGQRCTAIKIIYVHNDLVKKFNKKFNKKLEELKYGLPWEKNVRLTPLPQKNKLFYLRELLEDALSKGAEIINKNGGETNHSFMFPAILFPVKKSMRIYHEEQFGPIVPIVPFKKTNEVVEAIAESNYGQQVSVFGQSTKSLNKIIPVLTKLVSRVNINSKSQRGPDFFPFTGRKDSAVGTLSVKDALLSFSIESIVTVKKSDNNKIDLKDIDLK